MLLDPELGQAGQRVIRVSWVDYGAVLDDRPHCAASHPAALAVAGQDVLVEAAKADLGVPPLPEVTAAEADVLDRIRTAGAGAVKQGELKGEHNPTDQLIC